MAREGTAVVELDVRGGIEVDDSPLAIGSKLVASTECGWSPFGVTDEQRRRILGFFPHRDLAQQLTSEPTSGPILTVLPLDANGDFPHGGISVRLNEDLAAAVVETVDGLFNQALAETLETVEERSRSGWSVIWTGITKSTLYFGHHGFGSVYQVEAPGDVGSWATFYQPAVSPFTGASLPVDAALIFTPTPSAVSKITGETALPTSTTWRLVLVGCDANGKETNLGTETAHISVGANKVISFTVSDFSGLYASVNLYAKQADVDDYAFQLAGLTAGIVYHLSGNGDSDPSAPTAESFKFTTTGAHTTLDTTLAIDAGLNAAAIALATKTGLEKNLANGSYYLTFVGRRLSDHVNVRSVESAAYAASSQILSFETALAGYDRVALYARKNTGSVKRQSADPLVTPLTLATTYHLNGSGGTVSNHAGFTGIVYTSTNGAPGGTIANIIDGIVHLDALWLGQAPGKGRSTAYYTDPIDPQTIREGNTVSIPADLTCLFRCNVGPIDPGAQAHLLFGCTTCIWVLDGDPRTTSATLRRLSTVGIADKTCVTETTYGAVFLGTDGQFYIIPPGATQTIPLGKKALAGAYEAQFTTPRASLAWISPYVVYCANTLELFFADLSPIAATEPAPPKWWGPTTPGITEADDPLLTFGEATTDTARVFSSIPESGPDFSTKVFFSTLSGAQATLDVVERGSSGTLNGRLATLTTGFLSTPGHKVELRKVVLETAADDENLTITVTATMPDGTLKAVSRVAAVVATPGPNVIVKTVFDFSSDPVVGDSFGLTIAWPSETPPDLHRAWAEVRTQPKQDS